MNMSRPIRLRGRCVGGGKEPLICAPLVARDADGLRAEAVAVLARNPDLLEWRVDFFEAIAEPARVVQAAAMLRDIAAHTPILFTRRSTREGGQPIPVSEQGVSELIEAVCAEGCVDLVDCELGSEAQHFQRARAAASACGALLVGSFHDFQRTPDADTLAAIFARAQHLGADIAKVAVMPNSAADVLGLLQATLRASRTIELPLITMSMGPLGMPTRLFGWMFGSSVSFASGEQASAPGQLSIPELRAVLESYRRSVAAGDAGDASDSHRSSTTGDDSR